MISPAELRELSELEAPERAFLSVYLAGPSSLDGLEGRFTHLRRALAGEEAERNERDHFDENVKLVRDYLKKNPLKTGSLCLFACWAIDFFKAIPLSTRLEDFIAVDSSPFIRPLAEFLDEYENVAVVVADNKRARIFLVSATVAEHEKKIAGNVKNHVRKGGWSQQRYERRRDKQLLHYAREIVRALEKLDREAEFRRILLVGGKEILGIVYENLPSALARKVAGREAFDLGKGEKALNEEIRKLFVEEERRSEKELWERIRSEYLRGGLGVVGLGDVFRAAKAGRVEKAVVDRSFKPRGTKCRDCESLQPEEVRVCPECGSESVFAVDLVNEICELLSRTGGEADFVDPIPTLTESGRIAALLRY